MPVEVAFDPKTSRMMSAVFALTCAEMVAEHVREHAGCEFLKCEVARLRQVIATNTRRAVLDDVLAKKMMEAGQLKNDVIESLRQWIATITEEPITADKARMEFSTVVKTLEDYGRAQAMLNSAIRESG